MSTTVWPKVSPDPNLLFYGDADAYFSVRDTSRGLSIGAETYNGHFFQDGADNVVGTGAGSGESAATVAGPTAGIRIGAQFITFVVDRDFTLSGDIEFNVCARESSMNANATIRVAIIRIDNEGAISLVIDSSFGTELTTTNAKKTWTGTPTSTNVKKGNRFVIYFLADDATSVTMASGHTVFINHGGSAANVADTNIVFAETFDWISTAPSGTSLWLRNSASAVSGEKELLLTQGSGTETAVHTTVVGPLTFPGDPWTFTAGGSDASWLSNVLSAASPLSGLVKVELGSDGTSLEESQASPFDCVAVELVRVDADGVSNPVVWARNQITCDPASPPSTIHQRYLSGTDLTIDGYRLRFRVYQDDSLLLGNAVAGTNRTFRYDGTSSYAARLIFTQTITEAVAGLSFPFPPFHPMLHMLVR